jgi:superfamily II DNA or RNA helicase
VLFVVGRGLRTLRSRLLNNYVKKGKSPLLDYTFIKQHIGDEFIEKNSTDEVKSKSEKFTELAKKNNSHTT